MIAISAVGIVIAIGNALVYPAAPAATADIMPSHLRATGMGVYKLIHDAGIFIGLVMMGIIIDRAGMQHTFITAAVVFLLGTILLVMFYRKESNGHLL